MSLLDDMNAEEYKPTELDAVIAMLDAAAPFHLEAEVVWSALQAANGGRTIEEACAIGAAEWDV